MDEEKKLEELDENLNESIIRYVPFVNDQPQVPLSDLDGFPSDEEVREAILRKWRRLGKLK